jgi:GNAT superfamily N-acetyltransferase
MEAEIRPAVLADARALAIVAVETWRAAYAGIVPSALLDALDLDAREAGFRNALIPPLEGRTTHFGVADARIVGFGSFGPCRDATAKARSHTGEVYALYVLREHWGTGLGSALLHVGLSELRERALHPVSLWVLSDNARARRFYEREGFALDAARARVMKPVRSFELAHARYVRRDVPTA